MAAVQRLTRKEKQEQTRAAILQAAASLFAKQGYEGTSVEAIARAAGLTQGAIYSNFARKADLWWAIVDQMSQTLSFEDLLGGRPSLVDELREVGQAIWRILHHASRTELLLTQEFDLFLMRNGRNRAAAARNVRAGLVKVAALLSRGAAERGEELPLDAQRLAQLIDVTTRGLLRLFMLDPAAVDEDLCVDALTSLAGR